MKIRKQVSFVLLTAMLFMAVFGSAGGFAEEAGGLLPLAEPMTFTMMNNYFGDNEKLAENPVMKLVSEEMWNIYFDHIEVVRAESVEKANLLITSGDYPDCFYKLPDLDWYALGQDGVVLPLEDLIREYAPNLKALLDEREFWDDLASPDGHIYSLPTIGRPGTSIGSSYLWYNKLWLDNLGLDEPRNMDELYTVLKAFQENDVNGNGDAGDEIPLHLNMSHTWKNMQGFMTDGIHWTSSYMALMDKGEHAGTMVYYPRTEEFRDNLLKYMIQWYQEGLIDKNCFTQSYEQSTSIGQTSNIYGMFWNTLPYQAVPEGHITEYYTLTPFEKGYFPLNNGIAKGGFAITDNCEHPEILMAWVDYFYSEEGGNLATLGREGIDYVINEDGSYKWLEGYRRLHGGCASPRLATLLSSNTDRCEATYQNNEMVKVIDLGVELPQIINDADEASRLSDIAPNIKSYTDNYIAELMTGEQSLDASWDNFLAGLESMGVKEMESIYQAGYDRANPN